MSDLAFLPWVRRGFALGVAATRATATRANAPVNFAVTLRDDAAGAVGVDGRLLGPGDVVGLEMAQVIRTDPSANSFDLEPNYLAAIEFRMPDLPWLFTPWADSQDRLEPWIVLIVLEKTDDLMTHDPTRPLPFVTVASAAALPNLDQSWAWAHVQVAGAADTAAARRLLATNPERALSRLICPRRLEAKKSYVACVVPAFEVGRLAGLGLLTEAQLADPASKNFAWTGTEQGLELPVYYSWEFGTGADGDFESLVWELKSPAEEGGAHSESMARRRLKVIAPTSWTPLPGDDATATFEGALAPVGGGAAPPPSAALAAMIDRLAALLNAPVPMPANTLDATLPLPPPLYGRWHAGRGRVPAAGADKAWVRELNVDLAMRAAAGLGVRVVQEQQEALMASAWRQVGEIERANQLLRQGQLSRSGSVAIHEGRLVSMAPAMLLHVAGPAADRLADRWSQAAVAGAAARETLSAHVAQSRVAPAVMRAQFRRLTRARGPFARRFQSTGAWSRRLIERWNGTSPQSSIAPDAGRLPPHGTVSTDAVSNGVAGAPRACTLTPAQVAAAIGGSFGGREALRARMIALAQLAAQVRIVTAPAQRVTGLVGIIEQQASSAAASLGQARVNWRRFVGEVLRILQLSMRLLKELQQAGLAPATYAAVRAALVDLREQIGSALFPDGTPAESLQLQQQFLIDAAFVDAQTGMPPCVKPARERPPLDLQRIAAVLTARLDPNVTTTARVTSRLDTSKLAFPFRDAPGGDVLEPVMASPRFLLPMYKALVELSPQFLFPGVEQLPRNTVMLLESNRRFIEAFMVGLNHQMAEELLWREFPTDQRGTYFQHFWDATAGAAVRDIDEIAEWRGQPLGRNLPAAAVDSPVVLMLRGDLLRRYPRVLVHLQKARWDLTGTVPRRRLDAAKVQPAFAGTLPPDVTFMGFTALDTDELVGTEAPAGNRPGFFLVFQEPIGEIRFGLNETVPEQPEQTWRDLAWPQVTTTNAHLDLDGATMPATPANSGGATFGLNANAAEIAYVLLQRPLRVALHASDLI